MRKLLFVFAVVLLASCAEKKSDEVVITDFYNAVLGKTEMTDSLMKASLSKDLLSSLWEADYENTYSVWKLRTGYQDGLSDESSLDSIEPMGDGWYHVSYMDMGFRAITDVKMEKGKIADYRPFRIPYTLAKGYFLRNDVEADKFPSKITSQEQLSEFFGMATVMGEEGKPTEIDFNKSFVVPVVYPVTDLETSIVISRFWHIEPDVLMLVAGAIRGKEPRSFTIRPIELVVVDRDYLNYTIDLRLN